MYLIDHGVRLIKKNQTMLTYGIIGVSAVFVDLGVFFVLFNYIHIYPVLSTIISVSVATVYSFILNTFYNFRTKDDIATRLGQFAMVSGLGMTLSALFVDAMIAIDVNANIAKAVSLPPIVIIQYLLNSRVTFRVREKEDEKSDDGKPTHSKEDRRTKHVAVIGGGFTGLTAAYELSKMGYNVKLFEEGNDLGGLVSGFDLDGLPLEKAYHFLYKTDSDIIDLAKEIGVGDKLHFHSSSLSLYYDGKLYPFMTPKDLLMFSPLSLFQRIRAGLIAVYLSKEKRWRSFAKVSAMEWMTKWGGKKVTEVIWEPIFRGKFFNFYDKIAMSYVWSRVYVRANSKDPGEVTEKLGYFDGGFRTFTQALAERAKKNGLKVSLGARLGSIRGRDGKVYIKTASSEECFDACLATTPNRVFASLIQGDPTASKVYLDRLNSIEYLGAVLMVFSTSEKFTDYYWHNINDPKHPFLVLLSLSALVGTEKCNGKNVYYIGAYVPHDHEYFSMSDAEISTVWIDGVKKIFPTFDDKTIKSVNIFKFKHAQHIVDVDYEQKIPSYRSDVPGVYLANFTQIFPDDRGTNYAVQEGKKVADMIDNDLFSGKSRP